MRRILTASLKGHARRFVAGMIAIVLGVGFVSTVLIAMDTTKAGIEQAVAARYTNADLVATGVREGASAADLSGVDGVAGSAVAGSAYADVIYPDESADTTFVAALPHDPQLRWHEAAKGRLPEKPGEIAVTTTLAEDKQLAIGDQLRLQDPEGQAASLQVVGLIEQVSLVERSDIFAPEATATKLAGGQLSGELLIRIEDGADLAVVKPAVTEALDGASVVTGAERTEQTVSGLTGNIDIMGGFLLGFAAIAMFVAMLVVANTFTIVIAQRARELALFRCVGAEKGQVFGAVVVEALVIGLAASLLGVVVGVGLAQVVLSVLASYVPQLPLDAVGALEVGATALVIPALLGTLTTFLAALVPARRATGVPPLAALRPETALRVRSRAGAFRTVAGGLLLLAGGALLLLGVQGPGGPESMLLGVGGGLLSFLGVLLFSPILSPAVVRVLGLLARRTGVPGRVSADNAVRNPRRTAATASALLVGVTLISMLTVGAATAQQTSEATLDQQFPMDLTISANFSGIDRQGKLAEMPAGTVADVRDIAGIEQVAVVHGVLGKTDSGSYPVSGIDPRQAEQVMHNPRPIAGLESGVAIVAPSVGVSDGSKLTITAGGQKLTLTANVVNEPATPNIIVTAADLAKLDPSPEVTGVWAKVARDADMQQVMTGVEQALSTLSAPSVEGSAQMRALYSQVIDAMLMVAVGLLAMAVAIALVGVGNTLSLSVLERTRENALLRALGLTRGQLRMTLAVEAVLIAGAAVVIGVGLGIGYGFVGVTTLFAGVGAVQQIQLAIPWERLGLVALVALVAGVLASVLPARRAVRTPPSAALTAE